jgi:hypothetical protein
MGRPMIPRPADVKTCRDCARVLPISEFWIYRPKHTAPSFQSRCKQCCLLKKREYIEKHKSKMIFQYGGAPPKGNVVCFPLIEKKCTKCGLTKPISDFSERKWYLGKFRPACKACSAKIRREYNRKNKEEIVNRLSAEGIKSITFIKRRINWIKNKCKTLNIPFDLSINDVVIPEYCPALGIKLEINFGGARDNSPSIDRINPNGGYTKDNIVIVSNLANRMKSNATIQQICSLAAFYQKLEIKNNGELL